ncbi:hypothetical protein PLESTM_000967800 [Pleodorina starrii]|nr:hypothetical protein PLESTM_000967800 [Pleodorina starrii]
MDGEKRSPEQLFSSLTAKPMSPRHNRLADDLKSAGAANEEGHRLWRGDMGFAGYLADLKAACVVTGKYVGAYGDVVDEMAERLKLDLGSTVIMPGANQFRPKQDQSKTSPRYLANFGVRNSLKNKTFLMQLAGP